MNQAGNVTVFRYPARAKVRFRHEGESREDIVRETEARVNAWALAAVIFLVMGYAAGLGTWLLVEELFR